MSNLPEWAKYICKDRWGRVWAYSHEPEIKDYQGRKIWSPKDITGSRMQMVRLGSIPDDWMQTLVKCSENRL